MTKNVEDPWEVATFEGARRAQIRSMLQRSPRERLEAMIELEQTAKRLTALPRDNTAASETSQSFGLAESGEVMVVRHPEENTR